MPFTLGHHVHAVVHPIDEINVGMPRRSKHHFGASSKSFGGMRREIMRPEVSLDFDDAADAFDPA